MSAIRPLERADLPQVVSLYEHVARSGSRTPPPGLAAYFERTFLDHPWADAEIPSLVYVDGDKILGFLGSSVRIPGARRPSGAHGHQRPAGDGARGAKARGGRVPDARIHVRRAGPDDHRHGVRHGAPDLGRSRRRDEPAARIGWVRIFRPAQFASAYRGRQQVEPVRRARFSQVLDTGASPLAARKSRPERAGELRAEELTAAELVSRVREVKARLRPAYDEEFADWLLQSWPWFAAGER